MTSRENKLIAWFLALLATIALQAASRSEGFTRDEGYYFEAAENHVAFYEEAFRGLVHGSLDGFRRPAVDRYFGYNHEHPPLMKTLYGISWRLLHKCNCPSQGRHALSYPRRHITLGLLSESQALRLPAHLFAGWMVALAFLFGTHAYSRRVGLIAAVLSLAAPRIFFHSQLSCFDAPMATTWLLTIYCYWRSLETRGYVIWTGVALALALATKHNGFFLPFVILAHYLWVHRRTIFLGIDGRHLLPIPPAFISMALIAPLLYFALWPWMWFDPLSVHVGAAGHFKLTFGGRFNEYLSFHLNHVYYNFEYLGRNYNKPPFPRLFPFVMTLLTAPVTTLALALAGLVALLAPSLRRRRRERIDATPVAPTSVVRMSFAKPIAGLSSAPGMLIVANAIFPPAIISLTGAPIFGATKHWLPAIPFIALLAGIGAVALLDALIETLALTKPRTQHLAWAITFTLACSPAVAETWRSQPYGLSHYNLLAGGPAGGADLGMNRQFWGYSTRGVLPWLNEHVGKNGQVYWHDTNQSILNMNVREKLLRDDIGNTGLEEPGVKASSTAMVIHEKHFNKYEYWIWDFYGTAQPSIVLTHEGVPLVTVYQRPPESPKAGK